MRILNLAEQILSKEDFSRASKIADISDTDKEKAIKEIYDIVSPYTLEVDHKYEECEGMRYRPLWYLLKFKFNPTDTRAFIRDCGEHVSLTAKYILKEKRGISNQSPFGADIDKLKEEGLISDILKGKLLQFNSKIYRPAKHLFKVPLEDIEKSAKTNGHIHLFSPKDAVFVLFITFELVRELEQESELKIGV